MADKIAGKNVFVSIDGELVGCIKQMSFELATSMIDATTKCSKDASGILYAENVPNINSFTSSGNGLQPLVTSGGTPDEYSMQQLVAAQFQQKKVFLTWQADSNQFFYGWDGYITTTSSDANYDDLVTFDYEFTATGIPYLTPVS